MCSCVTHCDDHLWIVKLSFLVLILALQLPPSWIWGHVTVETSHQRRTQRLLSPTRITFTVNKYIASAFTSFLVLPPGRVSPADCVQFLLRTLHFVMMSQILKSESLTNVEIIKQRVLVELVCSLRCGQFNIPSVATGPDDTFMIWLQMSHNLQNEHHASLKKTCSQSWDYKLILKLYQGNKSSEKQIYFLMSLSVQVLGPSMLDSLFGPEGSVSVECDQKASRQLMESVCLSWTTAVSSSVRPGPPTHLSRWASQSCLTNSTCSLIIH